MLDSETQLRFIRSIKANLADDLPRLVYADWLEENGQEQLARFIRMQIEADRQAPVVKAKQIYEIAYSKAIRQGIIAHGEEWVKHCLPSFTTSGDYGAYDKLEGQKYGQICRFPADYHKKEYPNQRTYKFDVSDLQYWENHTIDWTLRVNLDTDDNFWNRGLAEARLDKSGIAISRGFPSHWRGKVIDWFTKVGRESVKNYPIERVEFSDLLNSTGDRWNEEIRRRYPQVCRSGDWTHTRLADMQDTLSRLAISHFE